MYKSLSHKSRSRWDRKMLLYALHLMQISDFVKAPHMITENLPCLTIGGIQGGGCSSFTNSSLHIDFFHLTQRFRTLIHSTALFSSFVHLGPLEPSDIVLLPQQCFLSAILLYRPVSQCLLLTVDVNTFFSRHWFSCAVMFGVVSLLSCKLVTDEIVL